MRITEMLRVYPHRASALTLALPLVLAYTVALGKGRGGSDRFPSVTMYANRSDNASVDADARCGYNLTDPVLNTGLVQNVTPLIKLDLN